MVILKAIFKTFDKLWIFFLLIKCPIVLKYLCHTYRPCIQVHSHHHISRLLRYMPYHLSNVQSNDIDILGHSYPVNILNRYKTNVIHCYLTFNYLSTDQIIFYSYTFDLIVSVKIVSQQPKLVSNPRETFIKFHIHFFHQCIQCIKAGLETRICFLTLILYIYI